MTRGDQTLLRAHTRVRFGVIYFAVSLAMITYIDRVCISNAAPLIRRDLGLSLDQMGYVFSIFAVAYSIFEVPCGYLCDRIGPRRVLMRVVLWWSFFTAATGWTWNYHVDDGDALPLRRGRSRLLPQHHARLHYVAAAQGALARPGHRMAERALGRRGHAAAGGRGDRLSWDGGTRSKSSAAWAWCGPWCSIVGSATTRSKIRR